MPAGDLGYRSATDADVDEVVALVESAYRGEASTVGWTTEAHLIDGQRLDAAMLREVLAKPDVHVLLAHADGRLQACCELRAPNSTDAVGYFGMFAVRPARQGSGIGRLVLAEAERLVRDELGASVLEMTVIRQRTDLIAWYERRGYLITDERRAFPYGDARYGMPKLADLEFVVLRKELRAGPACPAPPARARGHRADGPPRSSSTRG